jgi:branched-chain amino acid transport system substrate-binding protein
MARSSTSYLKLLALAIGVAALPCHGGRNERANQDRLVAAHRAELVPGIGFDRGMKTVEEINQGSGIEGRKLEVITRDTQGDPTKAVNAAELMNKERSTSWSARPSSRRRLATAAIARNKTPSMVYGVVDTDRPQSIRATFRVLPSNKRGPCGAQLTS